MDPEPELLVVLDETGSAAAMRELSAAATVTQALPPRLALARPDDDALERLTALPGVRAVFRAESSPDVSALGLSDDEALFVEAWRTRSRPKTRLGDGLAWDSPGFLPPDKPH
jgi:hypothetical protein